MKRITLSCGKVAMVDDDDYEILSRYRRYISVGKYATAKIEGRPSISVATELKRRPRRRTSRPRGVILGSFTIRRQSWGNS